jgi:hypothetical protein
VMRRSRSETTREPWLLPSCAITFAPSELHQVLSCGADLAPSPRPSAPTDHRPRLSSAGGQPTPRLFQLMIALRTRA